MSGKIGDSPSLLNRLLGQKTEGLTRSFEKLSSGLRINRASDGAAELAVATALLATADLTNVARRNIGDAVSAVNIAEGALDQASAITTRMGELAAQAANGTLSDAQRETIAVEFNQLKEELSRMSATTEFNGKKLLEGGEDITIQAGTDGSENSTINISFLDLNDLGLSGADISTQEGAQLALDQVKTATQSLANHRSQLGASVSRLDTAISNLQVAGENLTAAASRIMDVDMAAETANRTALQIGQQAAVSVQAQAGKLAASTAAKLLN